MNHIKISTDFTRYPAGRFKSDGPYSGEGFRQQFLLPIMTTNQVTTIHLDGVRGYGSSFLEEAFGGLVRLGHSPEKIYSLIEFSSNDEELIEEIKSYINDAANH